MLRPSLQYLKDRSSAPLTIAEIGVRAGQNAKTILENLPIQRLYLIDPYTEYTDGQFYLDAGQQNEIYGLMFRTLFMFLDKVVLITKSSRFASDLIPYESLDFVYIDANHSYENVKEDLHIWLPRLKPTGVLAGHDYGSTFEGVKKAVDEFAIKKNLTLQTFAQEDWILLREEQSGRV